MTESSKRRLTNCPRLAPSRRAAIRRRARYAAGPNSPATSASWWAISGSAEDEEGGDAFARPGGHRLAASDPGQRVYVSYADAWIEDIDFKDPDTGQLLNRELLKRLRNLPRIQMWQRQPRK